MCDGRTTAVSGPGRSTGHNKGRAAHLAGDRAEASDDQRDAHLHERVEDEKVGQLRSWQNEAERVLVL